MDLAVAFEHLQHQIEVGCAAQLQTEPLGRGCAGRGPSTVTPGGRDLSAGRRQLPGKAWPRVML